MDFQRDTDVDMMDPYGQPPAAVPVPGAGPPQGQPHLGVPMFPGVYVPGLAPLDPAQPQGDAMEEYARMMGVKLEGPADEPTGFAQPQDVTKLQANQAYFDNLVRERGGMLDMDDGSAVGSMTLPAGIGSGLNAAGNGLFAQQAAPPGGAMYNPATELAFNDMNRLYDPSSGFPGAPQLPYKPLPDTKFTNGAGGGLPPRVGGGGASPYELTSQTLPPEIFSQLVKDHPANFDSLNEDEKLALLKEAKSRERNRDHSRKSRLRKKEFVESLKQEVAQLHLYREVCEQSADLLALVSMEASAVIHFSSSAYSRVLGYQSHQLVPGQTSFLDLVHPVRSPASLCVSVSVLKLRPALDEAGT